MVVNDGLELVHMDLFWLRVGPYGFPLVNAGLESLCWFVIYLRWSKLVYTALDLVQMVFCWLVLVSSGFGLVKMVKSLGVLRLLVRNA